LGRENSVESLNTEGALDKTAELSLAGSSSTSETDPLKPPSYDRGVATSEVARATLTRFLPASLLSLGTVFVVINASLLGSRVVDILLMVFGATLGAGVLLAGGYWTGLTLLRRWLYPDAEISGRRSIIAGLMSPLGLFISVVLGAGVRPAGAFLITFVVGLVMALAMFFAWLSPTPDLLSTSDERYLEDGQ
jgi:hypothetical protein